jgi:hypothetical protein
LCYEQLFCDWLSLRIIFLSLIFFPSIFSKLFIYFCSGTGATGRSSSSFASMSKAPPYNISKPSTTLDIHTVTKPSVTHKAKVLYDYDAAEDDELSLLADEVSRDPRPPHARS